MSAQHTPGLWSVGASTGLRNQVAIEPAIGCAYGAGEEVEANARLIAAAPLLYAALVAARERMIGGGSAMEALRQQTDAALAAVIGAPS